MLIVNMDKLEMAKKELINAGIKGERAIAKLKAIENSMNKLSQREDKAKKQDY